MMKFNKFRSSSGRIWWKTGKTGKIKVYEYPTCDISFFIFFHWELIFNVGFIKFEFQKYFGGFFKIFFEDFS